MRVPLRPAITPRKYRGGFRYLDFWTDGLIILFLIRFVDNQFGTNSLQLCQLYYSDQGWLYRDEVLCSEVWDSLKPQTSLHLELLQFEPQGESSRVKYGSEDLKISPRVS